MDIKEKNIMIFNDTLDMISKSDILKNSVENSINKTYIYNEEFNYIPKKTKEGLLTISLDKTLEAAKKLLDKGYKKVTVLNFANAFTPGGSVKNGSRAQEECICRVSTLYPVLDQPITKKLYYLDNLFHKNNLALNSLIYTKDITVFKEDTTDCLPLDEANYYSIDVITSAAPDIRGKVVEDNYLFNIFKAKFDLILSSALDNNTEAIVLGAFGCGAFGNNPKLVAKACKEVLETYQKYFKEIHFAIYCPDSEHVNYNEFKSVLKI